MDHSLGSQGKVQAVFCPGRSLWIYHGLWFIPSFIPILFLTYPRSTMSFGHWALLANCLIYLVQSYQVEARDAWKICQMTFGVNAIIQLANLVTGGNYGFMRRPPVLGDHGLVLNYLIVTILMTGTLILLNAIVKSSKKRKRTFESV